MAMGEKVQRVFVDGKEFFGSNINLALKNITADMVDQVQVFDEMSEQAKFTKIDDGNRSKAINIKLKKDKNKGDFGRVSAGGGTDKRYDGSISYNRFSGNTKVSLISTASNTSKSQYQFSDRSANQQTGLSQFTQDGSGGRIASGGPTIPGDNSSKTTGINYSDTWSSKVDFRGSYGYSSYNSLLEQNIFRRYSFPSDSSSEVNSINKNNYSGKTNRINGRVEYFIDSMNSLVLTSTYNWQKNEMNLYDSSVTTAGKNLSYLAATSKNEREENRKGKNINNELLFRHRFHKPGRTLTIGMSYGNNNDKNNGNQLNPVKIFNSSGFMNSFLDINQESNSSNKGKTTLISASYTEAIGKKYLIEMNVGLNRNNATSFKRTFDYDNSTLAYSILNMGQSNSFEYNNHSERAGLNFRSNRKKINYQLGITAQVSGMENNSFNPVTTRDTLVKQKFINLFPMASLNFIPGKGKTFRLLYRGRTNPPGISQLQDIKDISNPLQIKTGNPLLKQEFLNSLNLNYNSFNNKSLIFLSANLTLNLPVNRIVNSIEKLSSAVIQYKPVNQNSS
jgi:hypothetical protein